MQKYLLQAPYLITVYFSKLYIFNYLFFYNNGIRYGLCYQIHYQKPWPDIFTSQHLRNYQHFYNKNQVNLNYRSV